MREIEQPDRRPLKIFAFDPMRGRSLGNRASITVPHEQLTEGPEGAGSASWTST